jgi:hypothetical protein
MIAAMKNAVLVARQRFQDGSPTKLKSQLGGYR